MYNDESKPENVSKFFEKLINEDKVDFLMGPVWAPLGQATVSAVEKYKKLEFYGTATFDPAQWKDWKYVVMVCTNGSEYLQILSEMIINKILPKDPDAKNIAIVHTDDAFGNIAGTWGYEWAKKQPQLNVVFYDKVSFGSAGFHPSTHKGQRQPTHQYSCLKQFKSTTGCKRCSGNRARPETVVPRHIWSVPAILRRTGPQVWRKRSLDNPVGSRRELPVRLWSNMKTGSFQHTRRTTTQILGTQQG